DEATSENGSQAMLVGYGPKAGAAKRRARKESPAPAAVQAAFARTAPPAVEEPVPMVPVVPGTPAELVLPPGTYYVPQAKPPVRKLARDRGVDWRSLSGSGSSGVITREDVERAASAPEPVDVPARVRGERRVPIKGVRRATAAAMVDSAFTAPHVTTFLS